MLLCPCDKGPVGILGRVSFGGFRLREGEPVLPQRVIVPTQNACDLTCLFFRPFWQPDIRPPLFPTCPACRLLAAGLAAAKLNVLPNAKGVDAALAGTPQEVTRSGRMILAADVIENRREVEVSPGAVVYDDRPGGANYMSNSSNRAGWGFCHEDGTCNRGLSESFAATTTPGSSFGSASSPYNWQFRHVITEATASDVGAESRIVSGGDIFFDADQVTNR